MYPNPADNVVTFTSANKDITSIVLFDILGNQVAAIAVNSNQTTINLSDFSNGIYIARIATVNGLGSHEEKLSVQH